MPLALPAHRATLLGAPPFNPLKIAGMTFWLDAAQITGLVNADPVTTWPDSSGNGLVFTQATSAKKPTYRTGVVNNEPVVRFDGVDDVLEAAASFNAGTLFAVLNYSGGATFTGYDGAVDWNNGSLAPDNILLGDNGTSNLLTSGATRVNGVSTLSFSPMATHKIVVVRPAAARAVTAVDIGNEPAAAGRFWPGDIAQVICYAGLLSTADVQKVEKYLARRYGIVVA